MYVYIYVIYMYNKTSFDGGLETGQIQPHLRKVGGWNNAASFDGGSKMTFLQRTLHF